jgi:hypothetical protein
VVRNQLGFAVGSALNLDRNRNEVMLWIGWLGPGWLKRN